MVIVPDRLCLTVQSGHVHTHRRFRHLQVRTDTLGGTVGGRHALRLCGRVVIPLHKGGFEPTRSFVTRRRFILGGDFAVRIERIKANVGVLLHGQHWAGAQVADAHGGDELVQTYRSAELQGSDDGGRDIFRIGLNRRS